MPTRSLLPSSPLSVGIVLVQEQGGDAALARLFATMAKAGIPAPPAVVVDRRRNERFSHEVSGRLHHVGAPSRGGWAAAVAAGAKRLSELHASELLVAATEEVSGIAQGWLENVDAYALATARASGVALGLIEAGGEGRGPRLAGGLLVSPVALARRLEGSEAEEGRDGPETLRRAGLVVVDLRVVRRLHDCAVIPGALPAEAMARLAGTAVPSTPDPDAPVAAAQYWLDEALVSETVRHGERASAVLRGWVVAEPMPRRVTVRVDGHRRRRSTPRRAGVAP
jgi:hypothetical protein